MPYVTPRIDPPMSGQNGKTPIPILLFCDSICGVKPHDWQSKVLLHYEAGLPTAVAACNYSGKTSVVFPVCALWTLYNFPRSRVMYLSATGAQVKNQFFAALSASGSDQLFVAGAGLKPN